MVQAVSRAMQEWQKRVVSDLSAFSSFMCQLHGRLQVREMWAWQHVADSYNRLLSTALEAVSCLNNKCECVARGGNRFVVSCSPGPPGLCLV